MKPYLLFSLLLIFLLACSEENEMRNVDVYEIRNIGELSTTEYTVGKIIKLNDKAEEWYKYGDRKILISCKAKIKAGVDLSLLKEGDIIVSGKTITIKLPSAKITSFDMNSNDINVEMESVSITRDDFTLKEKNLFLKQGELSILEDLEQTGIIKDANNNTEAFIQEFYKSLGFEEVIIISKMHSNEK